MRRSVVRLIGLACVLAFPLVVTPATVAAVEHGAWDEFRSGPIGRASPNSVVDAVRNRLIVRGGMHVWNSGQASESPTDLWALLLSGIAEWTELETVNDGPPSSSVFVYDSVRDRLILVIGGSAEVWVLPLAGAPIWSLLTPSGDKPIADQFSAIYDPVRDRVMVLGSTGTWTLNLAGSGAWQPFATAGNPDDVGPVAYDATRDRMVLFSGGVNSYWTWNLPLADGSEWLADPSGEPRPGGVGSIVYDPSGDRVVLVESDNEVWSMSWDGHPEWSPLSATATAPDASSSRAIAYDAAGDRLLVSGGDPRAPMLDVWSLSLGATPAWSPLLRESPPPPASVSIRDSKRDRLIEVPGDGSRVHVLPLGALTEWVEWTPPGSPPSISGHRAVEDPVRDRLIVLGGNFQNEVWELPLEGTGGWSSLSVAGAAPVGRSSHSMIYDPVRDRLVIYGGYTGAGSDVHSDVWALELSGSPTWSLMSPLGTPPDGRALHTAIYDPAGDQMIVFGGRDAGNVKRADAWALTLSGAGAWTRLADAPRALMEHSAVHDAAGDRMVVFGGAAHFGPYPVYSQSAAYALDLSVPFPAWTTLTPLGELPKPRHGHAAVMDPARRRMVIHGGNYHGGFQSAQPITGSFRDVHALQWTPTTSVPWAGEIGARAAIVAVAPNPSGAIQQFAVQLPSRQHVELEVLDLSGRRVGRVTGGMLEAGRHTLSWDGSTSGGESVRPGVYFARISGTMGARRVLRLR